MTLRAGCRRQSAETRRTHIMTDEQIRQILAERKRQERAELLQQRREDIKESIEGAVAWLCWAALGYMMFLGAYMVG